MHISQANHEDLNAILEIQKEAYLAEALLYNDYSIQPLTESPEDLEKAFATQVILKAEIGDQLVGSVRARQMDNVCLIGRLSVNPKFQHQGIGSALLCACENVFPDVVCCELFTGSKSIANLRLYERLGYKPVKEEVLSPQVTLIYLRKSCLPSYRAKRQLGQ